MRQGPKSGAAKLRNCTFSTFDTPVYKHRSRTKRISLNFWSLPSNPFANLSGSIFTGQPICVFSENEVHFTLFSKGERAEFSVPCLHLSASWANGLGWLTFFKLGKIIKKIRLALDCYLVVPLIWKHPQSHADTVTPISTGSPQVASLSVEVLRIWLLM